MISVQSERKSWQERRPLGSSFSSWDCTRLDLSFFSGICTTQWQRPEFNIFARCKCHVNISLQGASRSKHPFLIRALPDSDTMPWSSNASQAKHGEAFLRREARSDAWTVTVAEARWGWAHRCMRMTHQARRQSLTEHLNMYWSEQVMKHDRQILICEIITAAISLSLSLYIYIYIICMHACMYVCMYVYIHIYIHYNIHMYIHNTYIQPRVSETSRMMICCTRPGYFLRGALRASRSIEQIVIVSTIMPYSFLFLRFLFISFYMFSSLCASYLFLPS